MRSVFWGICFNVRQSTNVSEQNGNSCGIKGTKSSTPHNGHFHTWVCPFFQISFTVCRRHNMRYCKSLSHNFVYEHLCWLVILIIIITKWFKQQFFVSIHTEFFHAFFSFHSIQQCLDILDCYRIMISRKVYFNNRRFFCCIGRCSWVSRPINSIDKTWEY